MIRVNQSIKAVDFSENLKRFWLTMLADWLLVKSLPK